MTTKMNENTPRNNTPVTVLFSGGIDSTACIHFFKARGYQVNGLFIDYNQPALTAEKQAVKNLSRTLGIKTKYIKTHPSYSPSTGEILGRNTFMVSAAVFLAGIHEGIIVIGVHAGTSYYDCSVDFINQLKSLLEVQTDGKLTLIAPFLEWQKSHVYEYFRKEQLPLQDTYSCEAGTIPACGKCLSCMDRRLY